MAQRRKKLDPNQLSFRFDKQIDQYTSLKEQILCSSTKPAKDIETFEEACVEIARAVKRAMRRTNLSREQAVDAINEYFGWPTTQGAQKKQLSYHMFNHFLSKPSEYPIHAAYLFAIQHVTESLEPTRCLAEAEEARVISKDEVRQWALGKLDETIVEMQRLKKELRLRR